MVQYLSEEEQYKKDLTSEEISKIKDSKLRNIRQKFWNLRLAAFLNERHIPDWELEGVFNDLYKQEELEIKKYKASINDIN